MTNPVHRFKEFVIHGEGYEGVADYWYNSDTTGWLGSGVKDKNGVEIFEGDKVKVIFDILDELEPPATITFEKGVFWLNTVDTYYKRYPLFEALYASLEVVGHVMEEKES